MGAFAGSLIVCLWGAEAFGPNSSDLQTHLLLLLGKELIPELQCILHPYHASVHETGLRQDAH